MSKIETVEEFLARGGEIKKVPTGKSGLVETKKKPKKNYWHVNPMARRELPDELYN